MRKKISDFIWNIGAKPFRFFAKRHPELYNKHRDLIGSIAVGILGSIITYSFCSFMPYIFGQQCAEIEILIPDVPMQFKEISYSWSIIGFPKRIRDGVAIIGGGIGYSISYYLANFLTHLVSFLILRRFHKSHQNAYKQYFIGLGFCVLTTIITNMINGLWLPIVNERLTFLTYNIIVLGIIGTVNFIIGHFQNLILYKDDSKLNERLYEKEEKRNKKAKKNIVEEVDTSNEDIKETEIVEENESISENNIGENSDTTDLGE